MPSNNTKYSEEMRTQTAAYILESGKSATSVAEEMGMDKKTVCKWVRDYRRAHNLPTYAEENGIKMPPPREIKNEETRKKRLEEERALVRQVEEIFRGSDKTYGYRAMKKALEEKEIELSEYRIRRIMRENGMYPETRTKYEQTGMPIR